ncbi:MAG: tRNA (adenosine(37)-N6)-dimethylallyltransferase MiaA [Candidatus Absconditabacteria bacterium]|nr:tRNA (adenosine(37)-N6)-dimethylallyltransferase MiaA [Candidatus Absconditabacteria bacterium]
MAEIEDKYTDILQDVSAFWNKNPNGILVIRGATATGKSKLSILLAKDIPSEIISADSRQIFRHMNIGTDKVPLEIRNQIPHYQIDIVDPNQTYTAGQRKQDTQKYINQILNNNKLPIIVGGTGLYIDTIYKNFSLPESSPNRELRKELEEKEKQDPGYLYKELSKIDPEEAQKMHPNSIRYLIRALEIFYTTGKTKTEGFFQQPVEQPLFLLGLRREKEETNKKINARIKQMFQEGLIEEVDGLLKQGYQPDLQSMQGIGYKEIVGYLQGEYNKEKAQELLKRNTHHLAKKQRTRFRRYIAEGKASPKPNVTYKTYYL